MEHCLRVKKSSWDASKSWITVFCTWSPALEYSRQDLMVIVLDAFQYPQRASARTVEECNTVARRPWWKYHDDLCNVMKWHSTLCGLTLDNAYSITAEDSETTAELWKNLRRLAQNLRKIASTKADQYQKLYENFIAYKDLSYWLHSTSPGQGRLYIWFCVSSFTYISFL